MRTSRAYQTLPSAEAAQTALMAWMEIVVSRTPQGSVIRPINGLEEDDETRFSIYVWCEQRLIGAARGTEVFRGGEWLLITYDIEAEDV